jgi:isopenicillin-N epimerase
MIGSMAVVPLPSALSIYEQKGQVREWPALQDVLLEQFNIEVPIIFWSPPFPLMTRVSAQLYNTPEQYEYLAKALITLLSN